MSESRTQALSAASLKGCSSPSACDATWISQARCTSHMMLKACARVRPMTTGPWLRSSSTGLPPEEARMRAPSSRCTVMPSNSW
ncbi:hypothetical protein D9M70_631780 [compost metagenome]